jgi:hypothetical protein
VPTNRAKAAFAAWIPPLRSTKNVGCSSRSRSDVLNACQFGSAATMDTVGRGDDDVVVFTYGKAEIGVEGPVEASKGAGGGCCARQ